MAETAWEEARRLLQGICPDPGETREFEMRGRGGLLWQVQVTYKVNIKDPLREDIVLEITREINPDEHSIFEYRLQYFTEDGELRITEVNWGSVIRRPGEGERGWWDGSTVKSPRLEFGKGGGDFSTLGMVKYPKARGMEELLIDLRFMHAAVYPGVVPDPGIEPRI